MKRWIAAAGVLLLTGAGLLLWFTRAPSTPEEQLAHAEAMLSDLLKESDLSPEEIRQRQEEILADFRKVFESFPPGPKEPEARKRIAELKEQWGDLEGALEAFRTFVEKHPDHAAAEEMLWRAAELAETRLRRTDDALALYRKFLEAHPKSAKAEEAAWRIIALQRADPSKFPPGDLLEALRKFLETHPKGARAAEARLALGDTYRDVKEWGSAIREYDRVAEEHEGKPEAAKALLEKGRILSEQLAKKQEAKETFEKLEKRYPETPEGRRGGAMKGDAEKDLENEKAEKREKDYLKERYGRPGHDLFRAFRGEAPAAYLRDVAAQGLDIEHVEIECRLHHDRKTLEVVCRLRLLVAEKPLRSLLFQLMPDAEVSSVAVGEAKAPFDRKGDRLSVTLPTQMEKGATATLSFTYTLKHPEGVSLLRIAEDGYAVPGAVWYPFTLYGDLVTGRMTFTASPDLTVIATGTSTGPESGAAGSFVTWETNEPVFGLYFAYGKYEPAEAGPIRAYSAQKERAQAIAAMSEKIHGFYASKFGPVPFSPIRLVEAELPDFIGGVSPAGLIFLHRKLLAEEKDPTSLVAHEMAHQWWGNLVPVTLRHEGYAPWLSEGLATYSDALYLESAHGVERMNQHLGKGALTYLERMLHLPDDAISKCWFGHPEYFAVVYMKGAAIFSTLQQEIGDESFFRALKAYAAEFRFLEGGIGDLQKIFERESGRDLRLFFLQWVHSPGFPRFQIANVDAKPADGGFEVQIELHQLTHPPFSLNVELEFTGPGGKREIRAFPISKDRESLKTALPFDPESAVVDPRNRILKHPGDDNVWKKP